MHFRYVFNPKVNTRTHASEIFVKFMLLYYFHYHKCHQYLFIYWVPLPVYYVIIFSCLREGVVMKRVQVLPQGKIVNKSCLRKCNAILRARGHFFTFLCTWSSFLPLYKYGCRCKDGYRHSLITSKARCFPLNSPCYPRCILIL